MRYVIIPGLSPDDYAVRMLRGWRKFGRSMFRPECASCQACQSLRVSVPLFRPSRGQRRVAAADQDVVLTIGKPGVSEEKLALYRKYHEFQSQFKGWPDHRGESEDDYYESFVDNPFPVEEWCYRVGDRLIGVGYVDSVPTGLSAVYFYYDPDQRHRSPGIWNVLSVLAEGKKRQLPHVYLGYYVEGCRSLEYKAKYRPNEVLNHQTGEWSLFQS